MNVTLISSTSNAEEIILYIARVSSNQQNKSTTLINYLICNKHWSPFEHAFMTVEIETTRAIAAQILRHRSFSFQEFSQRYSRPDDIELYQARRQAEDNRQSSIDDLPVHTKLWFVDTQVALWEKAEEAYELAVGQGIAKECARFLLPLGTRTKLYMSGSLRSWIHYIELRTDEHTQLEHRKIAEAIKSIFCKKFPVVAGGLEWV